MSKLPQEYRNVEVGDIGLPRHMLYPQSGSILSSNARFIRQIASHIFTEFYRGRPRTYQLINLGEDPL
jgi:hypothetical protein